MRLYWLISLLLLLSACDVRQTVDHAVGIATASDPVAAAGRAVQSGAQARVRDWARNPDVMFDDAKTLKTQFDRVLAFLRGEVGSIWGPAETKTASRKVYVKYSQGYKSRAIVDFDTGSLRIETLDQTNPEQSLMDAIVMTLLTPDDPRAVDLYSAASIKLGGKPYLEGLIENQSGQPVVSERDARAYARWLWDHKRATRQIATPGGKQQVHYLQLYMKAGHLQTQARRYARLVKQNAQRFGVSSSLIFGVMKVESAFNPFAVSSVPAYGLMQLVPSTGGADAYAHARGKKGVPGKQFLFDASNNIELGTAYLDLLDSRYLAGVKDPVSREYAVIAAYNGGAGSVFKVFNRDRNKALDKINAQTPAQVYQNLRRNLASRETRDYLLKVTAARKLFIGL